MSEIDNVVLEKDAFDDDNTIELVQPEPTPSADHIEIGTHLDDVEIDDVLLHIAKTNELSVTWEKLQRILDSLINKQCTIMEDKVNDEETKKAIDAISTRIIHSINEHSNCPFTIQRLCELIIEPKKYYKMYIKYLRAVDKVLSVTSYWEDYATTSDAQKDDENKIEVPLLLPSFSVELEPHQFDTEQDEVSTKEEDAMEDVTKDEQVVEPIAKEEDNMEDVKEEKNTAEEVTKGKEDVMEDVAKENITAEDAETKNVSKEENVTKEDTVKTDTTKENASNEDVPKEEDSAVTTNGKMDLD